MASFFALPINQFRRVDSTSLNLSYVVTWMSETSHLKGNFLGANGV